MGKIFSGVGTFKVEGENAVLSGVNSFGGGTFDELAVLGINSINDNVKVNELKIDGICSTKSLVEANRLTLQGMATAGGDLRVHEAVITGMLSMGENRFEADRIVCKGMIQTKGEINADELIAEGSMQGGEIFGDRIVIRTENIGYDIYSSLKAKLKGKSSRSGSRVRIIEATEIELINVEAESVSGKNITIGKGCHIDFVDCSGVLAVDPEAEIKTITGEYTGYRAAAQENPEKTENEEGAASPSPDSSDKPTD